MDNKPTTGEWVVMGAGLVTLIGSFLHFYTSPSTTLPTGQTVGGGSVSAWGKGLIPVTTLIAIFAVIMAAQIALTRFANAKLPEVPGFTWKQAHLALGFFAMILAVAHLLRSKLGLDFGVGFWFTLVGGIGVFVGAIMMSREPASRASGS